MGTNGFYIPHGKAGAACTWLFISLFWGCTPADLGSSEADDQAVLDEVDRDSGDSDQRDDTDAGGATLGAVQVEPLYGLAPQWMDYVNGNTDGICDPATDTICHHGGEAKKVVLAGTASCDGITATDFLGAFSWRCQVEDNVAVVYTRSLKDGKGLADLVTAAGFKDNKVIVYHNNQEIGATALTTWWSNPVAPLSSVDSSAALAFLTTSGTVYTVSENYTSLGYHITANKVAIVTLGEAVLQGSASMTGAVSWSDGVHYTGADSGNNSQETLVSTQGTHHHWIEGRLYGQQYEADGTGNGDVHIVFFFDSHFSKVINLTSLHPARALLLSNCKGNVFRNIRVSNNQHEGPVRCKADCTHNYFQNISMHGAPDQGLMLHSSSHSNVITNLVATSIDGSGLDIRWSNHNTARRVTSAHLRYWGAHINNAAGTVLNNVAFVNNEGHGLNMATTSNSQVSHLATLNNGGTGIVSSNGTNNSFSGAVRMGENGAACSVSGGSAPGINADCSGTNGILTTGLNATSSFAGGIGDAVDFASVDWEMSGFYSGFGRGVSASQIHADNFRRCVSGNCREWDWRLAPTDSVLRGVHGTITSGSPCPASVDGSQAITDTQTPPNTFLAAASEILGDSIGDDDGLCESNEHCSFDGNVGAYQGDVLDESNVCTFSDGLVSGVTMMGY